MSAALLSFLAAALVYLHAGSRLRPRGLGAALVAAALAGPAMVAAGYWIWS